jgi:secreted Zn-dependent insulinase-like peptidase
LLSFDASRDKVVAQIKLLTPQKLADFFHQTVVEPQGMTISKSLLSFDASSPSVCGACIIWLITACWSWANSSGDKQPAFLWQRFQAFFPTAEAKLRAMKPEEFAQHRLLELGKLFRLHRPQLRLRGGEEGLEPLPEESPQTLGEEASKLSKDFDRGNMRFDSRDKVVAQIKLGIVRFAILATGNLGQYRHALRLHHRLMEEVSKFLCRRRRRWAKRHRN